jgi:hypothetical protein
VKFVCVESDKDFIVKEACDDQSDQISFVVILQRATMGDNGNNFSQFLANDPLPTGFDARVSRAEALECENRKIPIAPVRALL